MEKKKRLKEYGRDLTWIIGSEALSKIPDKRDIRSCRSVCRAWRSITSTPKFYREYRQNHQVTIDDYKVLLSDFSREGQNMRMMSLNKGILPPPISMSHVPGLCILESSDGLVLAATVDKTRVYVCLSLLNPLTGTYKRLPPLPGYLLFFLTSPVGLYIHPPSPKDDDYDYRVVCVCCEGGCGPLEAFVYSLRSDSWKQIQFDSSSWGGEDPDMPYFTCCAWFPPTSFGQCLYFAVLTGVENIVPHNRILCFDVETETFREIASPPLQQANFADASCVFVSLVVLDGRLHLYVFYEDDMEQKVDVWKMKKKNDDGCGVVYGDWVMVDAFTLPLPDGRPYLCTNSVGNWVAVLDEDDNSFKKVSTEDFRKRYPGFWYATDSYRHGRWIYEPSFLDPCRFAADDDDDDKCPLDSSAAADDDKCPLDSS